MGEWIAAAPQIEEDVALGNIALDLLGQARALLTYAGASRARPRSEDDLAYLRDERDFLNAQIVERLAERRLRLHDRPAAGALDVPAASSTRGLQASTDQTLAAVAAKAVKEVDYHRDHATQWTLRLGDGTDESHRRMQPGLDDVWPYVAELFEARRRPALVQAGVAVDPASLRDGVDRRIADVLAEATLSCPTWRRTAVAVVVCTPTMGHLLAEMQSRPRHPGATW